jgi:hypothetical protein
MQDFTLPILDALQTQSEFLKDRVASRIARHKLKLTSTNQPDVSGFGYSGNVIAEVRFRDSLRKRDMGAGSGYHQGKYIGINPSAPHKGRKKANIVNRPMHHFAHNMEEIAQAEFEISTWASVIKPLNNLNNGN